MVSVVRRLLARLWADDCGEVVATEYLALGSVLALGGVGGLVAMRDATVGEMQEYGNSVRQLRQHYPVPSYQDEAPSRPGSTVPVNSPPRVATFTP